MLALLSPLAYEEKSRGSLLVSSFIPFHADYRWILLSFPNCYLFHMQLASVVRLVMGDLTWKIAGFEFNSQHEARILPSPEQVNLIESIDGGFEFLLIVEKETAFKHISQAFMKQGSPLEKCLLITGRGYPDKNTKRFIKKILSLRPNTRAFVLVDADV
jgi:meiotic recombination protein SPO11